MITLKEASCSARNIIYDVDEEKDKHTFILIKYIQQHEIFENIDVDEPDLIQRLAEIIIDIDNLTK